MQILEGLNPVQQEAVCHTEGPLLILAGAGSGKTRVLTHRIAHLLLKGVAPQEILAVAFTNKAAGEMRERVEKLVGPMAEAIWVSTFHSACVRILRMDGHLLGLERSFVIYDTQDQLTVIKESLAELGMSEKNYSPRAILSSISSAKNELIDENAYDRQAADFWGNAVAKVYPVYQKKLRKNMAVDFDDIIMNTARLFHDFPGTLRKYQERFRYIMIDEYQDTNHAQYTLVKQLASLYRNLCVVGDDDQSIYSFRSADVRNILEFEKDYPEAHVVKLEQNYRSTQTILNAANGVVHNNINRKDKRLWTENPEGDRIVKYRAGDEREEAFWVAGEIERLVREEGRPFREFALLYRTNAQSRSFEEHFIARGLPYRVIGGLRFYERKEIKDILAYLRFLHNPADRIGFRRIVNTPKRGIGDASLERFWGFIDDGSLTIPEGLERVAEAPGLTGRAIKPFTELYYMLISLMSRIEALTVTELAKAVLEETGYLRELQAEGTVESKGRLENLDEFLAMTAEFEKGSDDKSLSAFLETVALVADVDAFDPNGDAVVLMTLHSAKGLEFPVVFLVGMEEGIFPHSRAVMDSGELEEERRLCYVGITRARERLYLTHAAIRMVYGGLQAGVPSRFLLEVPEHLIRDLQRERMERTNATAMQQQRAPMRSVPQPVRPAPAGSAISTPRPPQMTSGESASLRAGEKVVHPKWGPGTIVSISGEGADAMISVAFPGIGIKQLLSAYAQLTKA